MRTAGIDGCRAGWLLASLDEPEGVRLIRTEQELEEAFRQFDLVFIDIPIGLPDLEAHRECDLTLRKRLSPGRSSSVFPAPLRCMLSASSHAHACEMGRTSHGKGISLQTWNIVPKIREVDTILRRDPDMPAKVLESHPEWLFMWMRDSSFPLPLGKKTAEGRTLRRQILTGIEPSLSARIQDGKARHPAKEVAPDDLMDAWVLALSAHIAGRTGVMALKDERIGAHALPTSAASIRKDAMGLPMEIWHPAGR